MMNQLHDSSTAPVEAMQRLFAIGAALGPAVREDLARQSLTPARVGLIRQLHEAGPMSQRALSEALSCTPRNVTGLVDAVEALGLAERRPHPTDRRVVLVALTDSGERTVSAWRQHANEIAGDLFAGLSSEEVEQLSTALAVVLRRLRDRTASDPANL